MKLVSFKKDEAVIKICKSWAGDYDSTEVQSLGFEVDDKETGYSGAVQDSRNTFRLRRSEAAMGRSDIHIGAVQRIHSYYKSDVNVLTLIIVLNSRRAARL
jgi:hypothetical protein